MRVVGRMLIVLLVALNVAGVGACLEETSELRYLQAEQFGWLSDIKLQHTAGTWGGGANAEGSDKIPVPNRGLPEHEGINFTWHVLDGEEVIVP